MPIHFQVQERTFKGCAEIEYTEPSSVVVENTFTRVEVPQGSVLAKIAMGHSESLLI